MEMRVITPKTEELQTTQHRTLTNSTVDHKKHPLVVGWVPVRPGSQDHEKIPSRFDNRLEYRDGRKEPVRKSTGKFLCAVNGVPHPGHMCAAVIVGGVYCGSKYECEHKSAEAA